MFFNWDESFNKKKTLVFFWVGPPFDLNNYVPNVAIYLIEQQHN